jgi:hypothetical protein
MFDAHGSTHNFPPPCRKRMQRIDRRRSNIERREELETRLSNIDCRIFNPYNFALLHLTDGRVVLHHVTDQQTSGGDNSQ